VKEEELIEQLMGTFLGELDGHAQALSEGMIKLEAGADGEERAQLLRSLFRSAHSLKGAARAVNVEVISEACHTLEDLLGRVQGGTIALSPDLYHLSFALVDGLVNAGKKLVAKEDVRTSGLDASSRKLRASMDRTPAAKALWTSPPVAEEPAPLDPRGMRQAPARVPMEKLDLMLNLSGELFIARTQLSARMEEVEARREMVSSWLASWVAREPELRAMATEGRARILLEQMGSNLRRVAKEMDRFADDLERDEHRLNVAASALEDQVRRARMVAFSELSGLLARTLRDAAKVSGHEHELRIDGKEMEIDRLVIEQLRDPLMQLVKNAAIHGGQSAAERQSTGKPPKNAVSISVRAKGANVEIAVEDDGRGLDLDAIRARVRERGIPVPEDDRELAALVFLPSLSTSRRVTALAGRGVGLDVVKTQVEALHGTVVVTSETGKGSRFVLTVPMTLTTLRVLIVVSAGVRYAIATSNVEGVLRVGKDDVRTQLGHQMVAVRDVLRPIAVLSSVLSGGEPLAVPADKRAFAVVLAAGEKRAVIAVDEIEAEREIVQKTLGRKPIPTRWVSGATILPGGGLALIVNAAELVRAVAESALRAPLQFLEDAPKRRHAVLVADDSVTTRTLEASILEAAGYEVFTAADGEEALRILGTRSIDVVLADVEMPRMDGLRLTEIMRRTRGLSAVPVVLCTGLETEADRVRGLRAGANAYLVKRGFDPQELLQTIGSLI
jgi:two-component system chemotaxis sensor kinase CheA